MRRVARDKPLGVLLAAAVVLAAVPAHAQTPEDKRAQASSFFDAGAQAYEAGQYMVAAEAFQKAYELLPSPTLLFSCAQAYRRQYLVEPSAATLQRSIALYRDYLHADPKATRREDAMDALKSLVPMEATLPSAQPALALAPDGAPAGPAAAAGPPAPAAIEAGRGTRLLLSARPDGAQISLDGGPFRPTPFVAHVAQGPHVVRIQAAGYFEAQATAQAVANELMPFHVVLRPKPAKLHVKGSSGARVLIDGQVRAVVPTETPLAIEPGPHTITVVMRGHKPYTKQLALGLDQSVELSAGLSPTSQRIAAWTVLSVGAAGAVATGVLAGLAVARQNEALELRDALDASSLLPGERDRYNEAVLARNGLTTAALITGGATALTAATGIGLFVWDEPDVLPPSGDRPGRPSEPAPRVDFTVGVLSAGLRVAF